MTHQAAIQSNTANGVMAESRLSACMRLAATVGEFLVALAVVVELTLTIINVAMRSVSHPLSWPLELAPIPLASVAFIGGAIAYRRGYQLALLTFREQLSLRGQEALAAASDWIVVVFSLFVAYMSIPLLVNGWHEYTPVVSLPHTLLIIPLTAGMLLFALQGIDFLAKRPRRVVLVTGGVVLLALLLVFMSKPLWLDEMTDGALAGAAILLFAFLLLMGIPVSFVLTVSATFFLFAGNAGGFIVLPRQMHDSITGFVLLAVPFFILAGLIMTRGGLAKRISAHVNALIGHTRSGPLQVIVLSMYIFSGLSGSKVADIAAVGSTMKDIAEEKGYPAGEVAAVLSASAVMGETIPPSIAMLVLGSVTTISIATMFLAGLLPAVVLGITISIVAAVRSRKTNLIVTPRATWGTRGRTFVSAFLPLLMLIILIGGILSGIATPTEISAIAVVYSAILACFLYRELNGRVFWDVLTETAVTSGTVLFIISTAAPFTWAMTMAEIPDLIARLVSSGGGHSWIFMLCTIIALVITGAVLESLPALIIFGPILLPIAVEIGINPVQYGIVLLLSMGIGAFSPPIGVGMYVAVLVAGTTVRETTRPLLSYLAVLVVAVALIAAIPWISLVLPNLLGFS